MNTEVNTDGIIYVPQSDTYRIKVGERLVEVEAWALRQAWNVPEIESILKNGTDAGKKELLDDIVRIGGRLMGGRLVGDHMNNTHVFENGYVGKYDPIDALYRGAIDPADTVVACTDLPKPTPYYDPSAAPTVYIHNRFPSKRSDYIIDEAIKLLNAKKNLHMTKLAVDQIFEGFKIRIHSDMPFIQGSDKTLMVVIKHAAFDRAHKTEIDKFAGLMAKLDTDAYIRLRIAFLLYEALKTNTYNKQSIDSGLCEVTCFDTKVRNTR